MKIQIALALASLALLSACATTPQVTPAVLSDLAPTGKVRIGINFQNQVLTRKDPATGEPGGIAVDLARELARRLGVPLEIVPYTTAGNLAAGVNTGAWDVGFFAIEQERAREIDFAPGGYLEIETTYLVPAGSPLRTVDDVDRKGIRVSVGAKGGPDLALTRLLKNAELVRAPNSAAATKQFISGKLDALAGLRPTLAVESERIPGSRLLDGSFTTVQQSVGIPKGRAAGAKYIQAFVEDVKASGLVAQLIEKNGARGAKVAPPARP
jgi:polar amino acid transport system substrate-binding protein